MSEHPWRGALPIFVPLWSNSGRCPCGSVGQLFGFEGGSFWLTLGFEMLHFGFCLSQGRDCAYFSLDWSYEMDPVDVFKLCSTFGRWWMIPHVLVRKMTQGDTKQKHSNCALGPSAGFTTVHILICQNGMREGWGMCWKAVCAGSPRRKSEGDRRAVHRNSFLLEVFENSGSREGAGV